MPGTHAVNIYTIPRCPFCDRAKSLLARLGIEYTEHSCSDATDLPGELTTFPQIYFDGKHIGGCMDLYQLYQRGELA